MINAIKYEIVNKSTNQVHQVQAMTFGNAEEQFVSVTTDVGEIIFKNKDQAGELINDLYEIREVK